MILLLIISAVLLTGCGKYEYKKGIKELENGNAEEAADHFEKAAEKEYNLGDSYRGTGIARWESGDYEGAAKAFKAALKNGAEKTGTIYGFLGACSMKLKEWENAIEYYEKGLKREDCTEEMAQEMKYNIIAAYEKLKDWETVKAKTAEYAAEYPEDEKMAKEAEFFETR